MGRKPQYTVKTGDGTPVKEGDAVKVDNNLPATFQGIESPPWGDDEAGEFHPAQVRVRYDYGASDIVTDLRAGLYVDEV